MGAVELRRVGGAAVPTAPPLARAGHRGDRAGRGVDPADGVILGVDDEEVARAVDGEFLGPVERRGPGGPAVARIALGADAGAGRDPPVAGVDRAEGVPLPLED